MQQRSDSRVGIRLFRLILTWRVRCTAVWYTMRRDRCGQSSGSGVVMVVALWQQLLYVATDGGTDVTLPMTLLLFSFFGTSCVQNRRYAKRWLKQPSNMPPARR